MTQSSSKKPASTPNPKAKSKPATELSAKDLDKVAGGMSDIQFTKHYDKSSPKLSG